MTMSARRTRLRAALAGPGCIHPASVFDPISARIAEGLGFEAGMLAGSVASLVVLGAPDLILLTLTEFADLARRITRASDLPIMVDADHGYGNALNAMRSVQELEAAGIAGLTIEDTLLPRPYGPATHQVVGRDEAVGKLRAALAARSDPGLMIIGRTSAMEAGGVEEAGGRARDFTAAGVDGVFFTGVKTLAQLAVLARQTHLPIFLGGLGAELQQARPAALAALGVRFVIQGHQPYQAALAAVHATMAALRAGMAPAELPGMPAPALARQVTQADNMQAAVAQFLGGAG